jgi:hypothetical protein
MQKPTIKASNKPFKNKSSLIKKKGSGSLVSKNSIFLPELNKETSNSSPKSRIMDPAKGKEDRDKTSKDKILSDSLIKKFVKNIFNTTNNYNNKYPKAFSTTNVNTTNSTNNLNSATNTTNSTNNLNSATNTTNSTNNLNSATNTTNSKNENNNKEIVNTNKSNILNQIENKTSNTNNDFIAVENSKLSNKNNTFNGLKNYSDSHFTSVVKNLITPSTTKVYVNGKEKHVDSTVIKERIKQQSNVVPMFALGGLVSKPTLGLLGEKGPEMVTPMSGESALSSKGGNMAPSPNNTMIPDAPSKVRTIKSAVSTATNSLSPMNRQGAANMMQGNNTTNISNSNESSESFSQYNKTLSTTTNVSKAVRQLETKTDKVIESLASPKKMQDNSNSVSSKSPISNAQGATPQGVGQESGVSEGSAKGAFDRFFNNQTFSIPEWRQRMG